MGEPGPDGIFSGMRVFLLEAGVQPRRLQIWKQKLVQMGATLEAGISKKVTHVFAADPLALIREVDRGRFDGCVLVYQWLEDSLKLGEREAEDLYRLKMDAEGGGWEWQLGARFLENENKSVTDEISPHKKARASPGDGEDLETDGRQGTGHDDRVEIPSSPGGSGDLSSPASVSPRASSTLEKDASVMQLPSLYKPPDLNRNITVIFGKLVNIYRALADDRRSFSYYKAIPVIEKVPFKIESSEQIKDLPGIGKSLQGHIQEIVATGKLSKSEHFENDEKILSPYLCTEYGGPGTLLVEPFVNMADTVNERGLPGGPQAARAAVKWGQTHIDNVWKEWTAPRRRK